jgi:hypothetical protein
MRKIASLLLVITLFTSLFYNALEYYLVVAFQKERNWIETVQDKPESEFKVIKLNATLYSFIEDTELEKVNQNIIINDKVYHIFKKRIKDNILNLYYLGDENQNAIDISLKKLIDAQPDSDSNNSPLEKLMKSLSKDYTFSSESIFAFSYSFTTQKEISNQPNSLLLSGHTLRNYTPPKLV